MISQFIRRFNDSFRRPALYADVYHEPFKKAIFYSLGLIVIVSLLSGFGRGLTNRQVFGAALDIVNNEAFPDFNMTNGQIAFKDSNPYLYNTNQNQLKVIIDADNSHSYTELAGYRQGFYINSTHFIISQQGNEPLIINLNLFKHLHIEKNILILSLKLLRRLTIMLDILFTFIHLLLVYAFRGTIIFLLSRLMLRHTPIKLNAKQLFSLIFYAMSLSLVISELLFFIPLAFLRQASYLIYYLVAFPLLTNGIKAIYAKQRP